MLLQSRARLCYSWSRGLGPSSGSCDSHPAGQAWYSLKGPWGKEWDPEKHQHCIPQTGTPRNQGQDWTTCRVEGPGPGCPPGRWGSGAGAAAAPGLSVCHAPWPVCPLTHGLSPEQLQHRTTGGQGQEVMPLCTCSGSQGSARSPVPATGRALPVGLTLAQAVPGKHACNRGSKPNQGIWEPRGGPWGLWRDLT